MLKASLWRLHGSVLSLVYGVANLCAVGLVVLRLNPFSDGPLSPDAYFLYWVSAASVLTFALVIGLAIFVAAGGRLENYRASMGPMFLPAIVLLTAYPHHMLFSAFMWVGGAAALLVGCTFAYRMTETPQARRERVMASAAPSVDKGADEDTHPAVDAYPAQRPRIAFSQIVGMEEVKERLLEAGHEVVAAPHSEESARNGLLLFGEPGNGKTMFAEAIASELRLPFINVSFGNVVSKWIGETTENVMQVFEAARRQAPCVLFLDEIDSLIRDRNAAASGGSSEEAKTTNTLLTEIVNLRRHRVVLIAATNFLDKLDQAAIREGRFDYKIEITPPDLAAREAILSAAVGKAKGFDLLDDAAKTAARRWEGFSAARIRAVAEQAVKQARRLAVSGITFDDLMEALRTIQGRAGKLPEGTPTLDELTLAPDLAAQLKGLAARMTRIEAIEAMGAKVPQGLLFMGPPGTGKTVTARALAKSTGWAFLSVAGNELIADPDRIDKVVREARDIRPTIIFIDEADDVLSDRQFARHTATITNRLLTAMDGAAGKASDVVWIAATNHPDQIDPAALRGGRFTVKLMFDVPDEATLATYIEGWMAKCPTRFVASAQRVAQELLGLSIANAGAVLQHAVNEAVSNSLISDTAADEHPQVGIEDVREASRAIVG